MSTKATKCNISQVDYNSCRHKGKWTTEHISHWASVLYHMDRWTNISMSKHMKYEQVSTWHMGRKGISPMLNQVGYEACKIYRSGDMINYLEIHAQYGQVTSGR